MESSFQPIDRSNWTIGHVVSLPNSPRRLSARIRAKKSKIILNFYDALDARSNTLIANQLNISAASFKTRYGRSQTIFELACLLSHRSLYNKLLLESNVAYFLILEDDFVPLLQPNLLNSIILESSKFSADIVLLGYSKVNEVTENAINISNPFIPCIRLLPHTHSIGFRCVETTCGAVSYVVSRNFLETVSSKNNYGVLADDWSYYASLGLKVMHISPLCFREDFIAMESSLEPTRNLASGNRIRLPRILRNPWRYCLGFSRFILFYLKFLFDTNKFFLLALTLINHIKK